MASTSVSVNSSPQCVMLGIDDKSIKRRLWERAPRAIHTPLVYLFAEKGPEEPQLIHGNTMALTYGDATLDERSKFATHVTPYANLFLSNANPMLVKRLLPADIGPKSSIRVYMDVLAEELDEYEREVDGNFKRDSRDQFVTTGQKVNGYKVKFFTEVVPNEPVTGSEFGKGAVKTGSMTSATGVSSKKYPLFDVEVPHYGAYGNNHGFRIWAPTMLDSTPMNQSLLDIDGVYPFRISIVKRLDENSSSRIVETNYGERYDEFTLKPEMVDTAYNKDRYIAHVAINNYQDLNPGEGEPLKFGPLGQMAVYQNNIESLLRMFLTAEKDQLYNGNDLMDRDDSATSEDFYRINLFGLQQPEGIPYQTIRFDTTTSDGIRFTERTDVYLQGGSDGTVTEEELGKLVEAELDEWGNPDSPYQDPIQYPCSLLWDSGFPLKTKYKLGKFISWRKNTIVIGSTYVAGERILTASEESSRHLAIVERMRAYAESDFFATPTVRATVTASTGRPLSNTYRKRLPTNFELANMVSRLCASSSFRPEYLFDKPPYNKFELLGDVSVLYKPQSVRNKDWAAGMMYPERLSLREVYFAAARTIYKEDTSVLTSLIIAIICAECETVGYLCHKYFAGSLYTKAQLKVRVEDYCRENLQGRFGELVRIDPECFWTDQDNSRNYSWSLRIKVYGPMMRTVQYLRIEAYNLDDIPADSPAFLS